MKTHPVLTILWLVLPFCVRAQEQPEVHYGKKYLDLNIRSLEKYSRRVERQQKQVLARLSRKEKKLVKQLKFRDSTACARLQDRPLTFDSLRKLLRADSAVRAGRTAGKVNKITDSLRSVYRFVQGRTSGAAGLGQYGSKLDGLQTDLEYRQYINGLMEQRIAELKNLGGSPGARIPALAAIRKTAFYGKEKMKVWKQVADEPSKLEEKALEYLQGSRGFSFVPQDGLRAAGSMGGAQSEADLEKMGFQTRRQLGEQLQQQFGSSLGGIQDKLGGQVADWQGKAKGITGKVRETKQQVGNVRSGVSGAKQSLQGVKRTGKEQFKVNPMRGLPFRKRIEKGYSFQTSRATPDGKRPAMAELAGTIAFRHTPKLGYGIGAAAAIGLGKDWSHLRLSYEGVGLRGFVTHELVFGISAYGGYERFYRSGGNRRRLEESRSAVLPYNERNTPAYGEAVLLGLSKSYKINAKWNGAVQVLYDIWWKEKGLSSPIVMRVATVN